MSSAAPDTPSLPTGGDLGASPVRDRLTTTLFLAALFHGIVILGVTFGLPDSEPSPTPTLEVLLVTGRDTREADNLSAQYLAQRNQRGSGTTEERVRPANPASSLLQAQQQGVPEGNSTELRQAREGRRAAEVLSSRGDRSEVQLRSGDEQPAWEQQTPLALTLTAPAPIQTSATDTTLRLRGKRADGAYEVVPNTRESNLAPYLDSWRRKVERLGTLNFPQHVRGQSGLGNPVLEVALKPDGALGEVIVRRSSGRKEVDQAALQILRLASPFDPFPSVLRKQYSELRFAYEWQFLEGATSTP